MAVLRLTLDDFFEEEDFTLIAIHCVIEQYRLAYLINKKLNISLARAKDDVNLDSLGSHYALYKFSDTSKDITYNIVENSCKIKTEKTTNNNSLFFNETNNNESNIHLIPELKKVAYFLKIDKVFTNSKTQIILNKILEIPQVITAYTIDANTLKSKNNLIFN